MSDKVFHVCGEEWHMEVKPQSDDEHLSNGCDGYCDSSTRTVVIVDMNTVKCVELHAPDVYWRKVVRHEVIHAFLFESGLCNNTFSCDCWSANEEMVDWFAKQLPKINRAFAELGVAND